MPRVFYGGGKSQQSTSQVSVPPEVLAQYQNVNSIANQVAQTPFSQYSTDPNAFVAPLTSTQQAGILGTNQYSNTAQPFYQTAANLNTPSGVNSYLNPEANYVQQAQEQQFNQAQSSQLGNAIDNGAFGGSRASIAAANLQGQQALGLGQTMAGIYNNAVTNSQAAAGLEGQLGTGAQSAGLAGAQAQLTAGQAQQQTEQAGLTALYNQFLQEQSYPFQTTQFLGNIAEGTGSLSGSTTTSNQPAPFFSDARLKEDIEPIGKTFDGQEIAKFRYKGDKQTNIGLIAQDVEKHHPEAVGLAGGYKTVDYDAATDRSAKLAHRSDRGEKRGHFDGGGFALDPSYLNAQEQAYASAPWGGANQGPGLSPYGGKSHVPPTSTGMHATLAVAHPPTQQQQSGLAQAANTVSQLEGLGKVGKSLYKDAEPYVAGTAAAPAPNGGVVPSQMTPQAASNNASNQVSMNDSGGLGGFVPDMSGVDFGNRGGLMHRDAGGATYQDAASDDSSSGGDVPYDSGTGMGGLGIPDDRPHNQLPTAPGQNSSGSGSGLSDALGIAGDIGKAVSFAIPFLNRGGRVGLAGGGAPPEDQDSINSGVAELPQPGQTQGQVAPGQVLRQDDPGGVTSFLNRNQGLIVPALHGLGTMASSNSRYLGSAILQGLGGAADSYENVQNEMANRGLAGTNMGVAGAQTGLLGQEAGRTAAETGLVGAKTGQVQTQTKGIDLQNEQTKQALNNGDITTDANGNTIVRMPDGTNLLWGDWASKNFPPTQHQVKTHPGPSIPGQVNATPTSGQQNQQFQQLGDAGKASVGQDAAILRTSINSPDGRNLKNQSQQTENDLQKRYTSAIQSGSALNQIASTIESMPNDGALAGGPFMALRREMVMKYNDIATTVGHPEWAIDQNEVGTSIATDKLHNMMSFAATHNMSQNSFGALQEANASNPSSGLPKASAIKVLAGLYADKQPDVDRWNYLNEYKQAAAAAHPGTPNWYLAQNAAGAFNADHDQTQYGTEKDNIEKLLSAQSSKGNTILNGVYHNKFTPQQMQQLEGVYGKGIFRYFRNN